jgi:hypothetical protein
MRAGMNGEQYNQLNNELLQGFSRERAEAQRRRKQAAGVPDTSSVFGSEDNAHQIEKDRVLDAKIERLADEFRAKPENQGKLVPWLDLTDQAIKDYDTSVKADAQKQQATKELAGFVSDELRAKKKVKEGFVIDNNTSINDLISRGILSDSRDIEYVRKRIEILRRVQATSEVEVQQ